MKKGENMKKYQVEIIEKIVFQVIVEPANLTLRFTISQFLPKAIRARHSFCGMTNLCINAITLPTNSSIIISILLLGNFKHFLEFIHRHFFGRKRYRLLNGSLNLLLRSLVNKTRTRLFAR